MERMFFIKLIVFLPCLPALCPSGFFREFREQLQQQDEVCLFMHPEALKLQNGMFLPYFGGCVFSKALVVAKIHLLQLPVTGKLGKDAILSHRRQIYSFRRPADLWQHLTDLPAVIQLFQIFRILFFQSFCDLHRQAEVIPCHVVGIGIVRQPLFVLIRSDHITDMAYPAILVPFHTVCPEYCSSQNDLIAPLLHELFITSSLIIFPYGMADIC